MITQHGKQNNVKGLGVDADPRNDPTYPMKKHLIGPQRKPTWDRPALQTPGVEILRSTERPTLSATFGESVPPAGLSGWIRRMAYRYSENKFRHWLPLLVADRVNVWEGLAEDLAKGKLPNMFRERGMRAAWKYDRPAVLRKIAVAGLITGACVTYWLVARGRATPFRR